MTPNTLHARLLMTAAAALALAGCETVAESVDETYSAMLQGSQEVPGPGDPDGSANAEVTIVDAVDNVCYEINDVRGISPATAAHIHRGASGVAGPPVVTLQAPTDGESQGCIQAPEAIADEIEANPSGFYVNVHTADYPNGAIRGQLRDWD
jgi:hypothetical protein